MSSIKAFSPGDIIVVDELSVDGNLYIWHKRQGDVPKKYREEVVAFLDNYACNQGVYAYEIVWEPEMTWQDSARITITVGGVIYSSCTPDYVGLAVTASVFCLIIGTLFFNRKR